MDIEKYKIHFYTAVNERRNIMGSIVVYYSLEGNTEYIAENVAEKLGADILRIDPKKAYAGVCQVLLGWKERCYGRKA